MCVKTGESRMEDIMKKKFFAFATIALLSVMCLSVFAACTTDVDGKTFVFESFDVEFDEETKETAEEMGMDLDKFTDYIMEEIDMKEMFSPLEISFNDGKATMTYGMDSGSAADYEQNGKIITIEGLTEKEGITITVSGSKLVMEPNMEMEGIEGIAGIDTFKVIFKQK